MLIEENRKRAMRESVAIDLAARTLTLPLAKQLEGWNSRIAYFQGIELRYQRGRATPDTRQSIAELKLEVERGLRKFRAELSTVPLNVLRCGRIHDVERSVGRLQESLLELAH